MLEARPSSGARSTTCMQSAARPRCEAWLLLRNLCSSLSLRMAFRVGRRQHQGGPVLNAKCKLQINYPTTHTIVTGLSLFPLSCMHACLHILYSWTGLGGPPSSTQPPPQLPWVERPAPAGPVAKVEFEDRPPSFFSSSSHRCLGQASSCTPCAGESEHSAMSLFRFVKLSWGREALTPGIGR